MAVAVTSSAIISSSRNPLVRYAIRLRDNRFRQKERAVIVDGVREIERAIVGGLRLRTLLLGQSHPTSASPESAQQRSELERQQALIRRSAEAVVTLTNDVMAQVAYGGNLREAVAVFDQPDDRSLDKLVLGPDPLVVVMVGIEKPGNAGAIFRSADAVGADAVVLCQTKCDLFNPNLIRGSLGTVFTVPCAEATEQETLAWLGRCRLTAYAAIVGAGRTMWQVDYRGPSAIIVGSEAEGLGPLWRENSGFLRELGAPMVAVSIPMLGVADSLNVSVSAAAFMFEARRQRTVG
jgi:TrmH family RNA methyltransferase